MCYSAMVVQDARKYAMRFHARIQIDLYRSLFARRLAGERILINKAMEYPFTQEARTPEENEIKDLILKWHEQEITRIEKDLFAQKRRLADAERVLKSKETKRALDDQKIAKKKIVKFKKDLERHMSREIGSESEERIFPLHYMTMLCLDSRGEKVVVPARYLLRPRDKDESFDMNFNGCYNARLDSLDRVAWWKAQLGKRHGLIMVKKFYENVSTEDYLKNHRLPQEERKKDNQVLCFEPGDHEIMFVPVLWDHWKKGSESLISAALITDEPAPEVAAAGHDRTPIFLKESAVDAWLTAKAGTVRELEEVLSQRERPQYRHRVLGAAS